MKSYSFLFFAMITGTACGQSTLTEFDLLKKQREVALEKAVTPVRVKYSAEAEALIARAIQAGDLPMAEKIRREFPKDGKPGALPASAFNLDTFLRGQKWQWTVARASHLGTRLEFLPNGKIKAKERPDAFVRWELVGADQVRITLTPDRPILLQYDPQKVSLSDKGTISLVPIP